MKDIGFPIHPFFSIFTFAWEFFFSTHFSTRPSNLMVIYSSSFFFPLKLSTVVRHLKAFSNFWQISKKNIFISNFGPGVTIPFYMLDNPNLCEKIVKIFLAIQGYSKDVKNSNIEFFQVHSPNDSTF